MSTTVYNGYVFTGFKSLLFHNFLNKFNEIKEQIIHEQKMKILKTFYLDYIISDNINNLDELNMDSSIIHQDLYESLSFIVFPKHKNKTFCMIFGDLNSVSILENCFSLSEYMYYDNSDRPKNISKRSWKKRDDSWAEILGGHYNLSPNEAGINFGIKTSIFDITQDDFIYFKNNINLDSIKKSIFRDNFYINHKDNTSYSKVAKDYRKLNSDYIEKEISKIELNFNFKFPNTGIKNNNRPLPSYQDIPSDKYLTLDEFCKKFNQCYHRRILKLNSIFKSRFKDKTIDDYIDSDRDRTSEIIKLIDDKEKLFFAIDILKMQKFTILFHDVVNIHKEINMDREILNYFWDK